MRPDNNAVYRWRKENPEKYKAIYDRYHRKHRKEISNRNRETRLEQKVLVLTHYGKQRVMQCCWEGCLISDLDMLSLDHMNNDGAKHRKSKGRRDWGGVNLYSMLIRNGFPEGYQTLCMNHQFKKQAEVRRGH